MFNIFKHFHECICSYLLIVNKSMYKIESAVAKFRSSSSGKGIFT